MPSHMIHLAIATDINKELKLNSDEIMLGSVMPDLCESGHTKAHYPDENQKTKATATPTLFIKKNKKYLNNPIFVGILIHLLTDKFYNSYFFDNYYIYDKNNKSIGLRIKNKDVYLPSDEIKKMKHQEFDKYDKYLLLYKKMNKFQNISCIDNVINYDKNIYNKEKLKAYITKYNKKINDNNKLLFIKKILYAPNFKLTKLDEMNKLYKSCEEYIFKYLKENNIYNQKGGI